MVYPPPPHTHALPVSNVIPGMFDRPSLKALSWTKSWQKSEISKPLCHASQDIIFNYKSHVFNSSW